MSLIIDVHPLGGYRVTSKPAAVKISVSTPRQLSQVINHYFHTKPCPKSCPVCRQIQEQAKKGQ